MDAIDSVFEPLRILQGQRSPGQTLPQTRPERIHTKVAVRTAIGFVVMGFVGFFVKHIFIPINNINVGAA